QATTVIAIRSIGAVRSVRAVGSVQAGFALEALITLLALRADQLDVRVRGLAFVAHAQAGAVPGELQAASVIAVSTVHAVCTVRAVCTGSAVFTVGTGRTSVALLAFGALWAHRSAQIDEVEGSGALLANA